MGLINSAFTCMHIPARLLLAIDMANENIRRITIFSASLHVGNHFEPKRQIPRMHCFFQEKIDIFSYHL